MASTTLRTVNWGVMMFFAVGVGLYALGFFFVDQIGAKELKAHFATIPVIAYLHIIPGGIALILGAFQFNEGLRRKRPVLHRRMGQFYVAAVALGGIGGVLLAWYATQPPATRLGFGSLGVLWLVSCYFAYTHARARNFDQHRAWMIRCYALTLAAVTLRLQLPILQAGLGLSFFEAYQVVAWFCWVPNLVIAEWLVVNRPRAREVAA